MERINDLVGYENLRIFQNDDWFKFSLESVLLPSFVCINKKCEQILDLCTGNAPIPLILSQKTDAHITGVEIQHDIALLAQKSVDYNHLSKQITIINDNINNLLYKYDSDYFDIITCNPPYFTDNQASLKNDDIHKMVARHEIYMSVEDIFKIAKKLLKNNGKLYIVHRVDRFAEIIQLIENYRLKPKRVQFIYPKKDSDANLFLLEATKNGNNGLKVIKPLIVHKKNGEYQDEILKMFKREGDVK